MDNIGDWIYIVFLIIAAASGLFGSKGKKKSPSQVLGQPDYEPIEGEKHSSDKGFWEILEEATNEHPERRTRSQKNVRPQKTVKQMPRPPHPSPFLNGEQSVQRTKVGSTAMSPVMIEPAEEEPSILQDIDFSNTEDLRKAVIYSEILNRKY